MLPVIAGLASRHPERIVFTRFLSSAAAGADVGEVAALLYAAAERDPRMP
jgi:hypothetical protein